LFVLAAIDSEFKFWSNPVEKLGKKQRDIENVDIIMRTRETKKCMPESKVLR
jgi:hypothetical protein